MEAVIAGKAAATTMKIGTTAHSTSRSTRRLLPPFASDLKVAVEYTSAANTIVAAIAQIHSSESCVLPSTSLIRDIYVFAERIRGVVPLRRAHPAGQTRQDA